MPVFAVMAGPAFQFPNIFLPREKKSKRFPEPGENSKPQFPGSSLANSGNDYIGPAERRGPHNLKTLTEVTGGGVFTAHSMEDLPRIVRTIGLAVRYRYVLTYKPITRGEAGAVPGDGNNRHKLRIELCPKDKFTGYGIPYYKRGYSRIE